SHVLSTAQRADACCATRSSCCGKGFSFGLWRVAPALGTVAEAFLLLVPARRAAGAGAARSVVLFYLIFLLVVARRAQVVCAAHICVDSGLTFVDF
ncbi:hypothetical protein A2U01_0068519, partial [Trifolium medium]|nr:hypothetical protein [Trifolium medium]